MLDKLVATGQTVYHRIYGQGTVIHQESSCYYGVKFARGIKCLHDSDLYSMPVDIDGRPLTSGVKAIGSEVTPVEEAQYTADLIISINNCYTRIAGHKSHIDYLLSLSEDRTKYNVSKDNFKFKSLDNYYLQKSLKDLEEEHKIIEEERLIIEGEVDDDDYK